MEEKDEKKEKEEKDEKDEKKREKKDEDEVIEEKKQMTREILAMIDDYYRDHKDGVGNIPRLADYLKDNLDSLYYSKRLRSIKLDTKGIWKAEWKTKVATWLAQLSPPLMRQDVCEKSITMFIAPKI